MIRCPRDRRRLLLVLVPEPGETRWAKVYRCRCGYVQVATVLARAEVGL